MRLGAIATPSDRFLHVRAGSRAVDRLLISSSVVSHETVQDVEARRALLPMEESLSQVICAVRVRTLHLLEDRWKAVVQGD